MELSGRLAVVLALGLLAAPAAAADAMTLKQGAWVCGTLEAYREASTAGWHGPRFSLQKLRDRQQEQAACLFVDDELLEDMMPPFVTVLAHEGDYAKVSFVVEYYQRVRLLHRRINRIQFVGWTGASSVEIRAP